MHESTTVVSLTALPPHVRRVVEEFCRHKVCEAEKRGYERGKADGQSEVMAGLKALSCLAPQPTGLTMVSAPSPVMLAEEPAPEFDFSAVLDDLFGEDRWSDLDRQELLKFVMAAVQESLAGRGKDPTPVLDMLRQVGTKQGFDAAMAGPEEFGQFLSWQAVPIRNPRGDFRFKAVDSESGNELYGDKAIEVMRRHNRDRFAFNPGAADPAMRGQRFDLPHAASLDEHTDAYRKAKESISGVRSRLAEGGVTRPGDLVDYQDHLSLMSGDDLRRIRSHLIDSLTRRIRAGKTKGDRAENIREALGRLQEAVREISTAVLKHAESVGHDISHDEAVAVEQEVEDDVLIGGELDLGSPDAGEMPDQTQLLEDSPMPQDDGFSVKPMDAEDAGPVMMAEEPDDEWDADEILFPTESVPPKAAGRKVGGTADDSDEWADEVLKSDAPKAKPVAPPKPVATVAKTPAPPKVEPAPATEADHPAVADDPAAIHDHMRRFAEKSAHNPVLRDAVMSAVENADGWPDEGVGENEKYRKRLQKRLLARRIISVAHQLGRKGLPEAEDVHRFIRSIPGVVQSGGEVGEVVPFDPRHMDSDDGVAPGQTVRVVRPGFSIVEDPSGGNTGRYIVLQSNVRKA